MSIVLTRGAAAPEGVPAWTHSVGLPASALSGPAATVPPGAEVLAMIGTGADRAALSGLAWDLARLGVEGPLLSAAGLASDAATADLFGLLRVSGAGLVVAGQARSLLEPARRAGLAVAPAFEHGTTDGQLSRAARHAVRDGAVIVVIEDTQANRAAIDGWLQTEAAQQVTLGPVSRAMARIGGAASAP